MPRLCSQKKRDEYAKPHPATEKSYKSTSKEKKLKNELEKWKMTAIKTSTGF